MAVHQTRRELDVMAVLWEHGSATVGDVKADITDEIAYVTVLTVLRTLELKGHVRHVQEGKAFRYFPRTKSTSAGSGALARVLEKMYRGSREMLVAGLLDDENVTEAELRRLQKMIEQRLRETKK